MKWVNNNRGYILLEVVLFSIIVFMIISAMSMVSYMDYRIYINSKDNIAAYYITESALQIATAQFLRGESINNQIELKDSSGSIIGKANIAIEVKGNNTSITATGSTSNNIRRKMKAVFQRVIYQETLDGFFRGTDKYNTPEYRIKPHVKNLKQHFSSKSVAVIGSNNSGIDLSWEDENSPKVLIVLDSFVVSQPMIFYGIIYSRGNITLPPHSRINGIVYCEGGIYIGHSLDYDSNISINGLLYNFVEDSYINYSEDIDYAKAIEYGIPIFNGISVNKLMGWYEIK